MIDCIRTYRLQHKLGESFGFSQWHYDTRNALLVEVVDDSGASGWGECYGPATVTKNAIDTFYAPLQHLMTMIPGCQETWIRVMMNIRGFVRSFR